MNHEVIEFSMSYGLLTRVAERLAYAITVLTYAEDMPLEGYAQT